MNKILISTLLALALCGCGKKKDSPAAAGDSTETGSRTADLVGVDRARKVVRVGMLNDESGPAIALGKPYANGKRLLVRRINAGNSGLLPPGWTVELIEKDHGYNPQRSVQHFHAVKDQVLFIGTSFGTPNTMPLLPFLEREALFAFPASLSTLVAANEFTPPPAASYRVEARRAMDWVVDQAGGADRVKAGIVYQEDDYGKDGLEGWKEQAALHGVSVVAEKTVTPGQKDVTAVVSALAEAGATHVMLSILPSTSGPILGTAKQLDYQPVWLGNTPAWTDRFFSREVIPPEVFDSFYWVIGLPYWGEDRPGMAEFLAAWERHGKDMGKVDSYVLMGYVGGLIQIEALRRAIDSGDLSRAGFRRALHSIKDWNAGGLIEPVDLSEAPYVVNRRTRVLRPIMDEDKQTWEVVGEVAEPLSRPAQPRAGTD